jgi:hypothetical protein
MTLASGILTNRKALGDEIPKHRVGNLEEGAKLIAFSASDGAPYIAVTTVFIYGGLMRQAGSL